MRFEYDPYKSDSNKLKHGLDFDEAKKLWADKRGIEIGVSGQDEPRQILIARYLDKHWTAVFTYRDEGIRLISVRRARLKEISLYDNR